MENKIFIIEDDPTIVTALKNFLNQWGYDCFSPTDFQKIDIEFAEQQPALVLIDISLPYFNGFYWCKAIRAQSEVPIIFLSSAEEQMNQIMAMNMGADDFMAKPFDLNLLLAKIQALLRRSYQYGQAAVTFNFQDYTFTPTENSIKAPDQQASLSLSPNESRILLTLCQHQGQVVAKETIIEALWQSDAFIDNNTLAVNLTRLRKKLTAFGIKDLIQTVKNKGYFISEP